MKKEYRFCLMTKLNGSDRPFKGMDPGYLGDCIVPETMIPSARAFDVVSPFGWCAFCKLSCSRTDMSLGPQMK